MIFTHLLQTNPQIDDQTPNLQAGLSHLFFYFMPWFFFKAGQFYKPKPLKEVVKDSYKRLLVPFCVFSFLGHLLYCLCLYLKGDSNIIHYTLSFIKAILFSGASQGNQPIWFLLSLFIVRIVYSYITARKVPAHIIAILALTISCLLHELIPYLSTPDEGFGIPLYFLNSTSGIFFYAMGVILRNKQYSGGVILSSVFIYITIALLDFSVVGFRSDNLMKGHYLVYKIDSIAGIVIINSLLKLFSRLYKMPILSYIGRNSMYFLILHYPLMTLTLILYSKRGLPQFFMEVIVIILVVPIIAMLTKKNKWLSYIFGEKLLNFEMKK